MASASIWHVTQDLTVEPSRRTFALFQDMEAAKAVAETPPKRSSRAIERRLDRLERGEEDVAGQRGRTGFGSYGVQ